MPVQQLGIALSLLMLESCLTLEKCLPLLWLALGAQQSAQPNMHVKVGGVKLQSGLGNSGAANGVKNRHS